MRNFTFAFLALLPVASAYGQTPVVTKNVPAAPPASMKPVSIDVKEARFGDAILALAKQGHFSFVADAYLLDFPLPRVQIEQAPVNIAIKKLAELYDRKITVVNGVFILSRNKRELVALQDKYQQSNYGQIWASDGEVSIKPIIQIPNGTALLKIKPEMMLPSFVSIEANSVAVSKFTGKLSSATDWLIFPKNDFAERRLSAYFERTTPGEVAEAITTLFHARQRVVIEQSDAQVKQDAAQLTELTDKRSPRDKASNALLPQILKALTTDQRDKYDAAEQVEISVSKLPAAMQKSIVDFITLAVAELDKTSGFPHPDPTKGYSLMIWSRNTGISVFGSAQDGTRLGF